MNSSLLMLAMHLLVTVDPVLKSSIQKVKDSYAKTNFTAIFISSNVTNLELLQWVSKEFANSGPVLVFNIEHTSSILYYSCLKKPTNIIILSDDTDIQGFAVKLRDHYFWDARSNVLVLTLSNVTKWIEELWKHTKAVDVVVVSEKGDLHSWFPYSKGECSNVQTVRKISASEIFSQKLPSNFNECLLSILTSEIYPLVVDYKNDQCKACGIEVNIISSFIRKYNFNATFFTTPEEVFFWDMLDENERPTAALKMIYNDEADVVLGGLQRRWEYFRFGDLTISHLEDYLSWYVPIPDIIQNINKLQLAFPVNYWLYIICSFCLIVLTFLLTSLFSTEVSFMDGALSSWGAFLFSPVTMPKKLGLRVLLMMTYAYSLHITAGFQSSMIFMLSHQILEPAIVDIEQVFDRNLKFHFHDYHRSIVEHNDSTFWTRISSRHLEVFKLYPDYPTFAPQKTGITLGPKAVTSYYMKLTGCVDKYGRIMLAPLKTPYMSTPYVMLTPPGHPLFEKLTSTSQQLIEGGLPEFWFKSFKEKPGSIPATKNVPLTFDALIAAFCILAGFLVFSLVLFVGEVLWKMFRDRCCKSSKKACEDIVEFRKARDAFKY